MKEVAQGQAKAKCFLTPYPWPWPTTTCGGTRLRCLVCLVCAQVKLDSGDKDTTDISLTPQNSQLLYDIVKKSKNPEASSITCPWTSSRKPTRRVRKRSHGGTMQNASLAVGSGDVSIGFLRARRMSERCFAFQKMWSTAAAITESTSFVKTAPYHFAGLVQVP